MHLFRFCIKTFIVFIFCYLGSTSTMFAQPSPAYQAIQGIQDQFPIPIQTQSVNVGTFNAATGKFTGMTTQTVQVNDSNGPGSIIIGPNGKPIPQPGTGGKPNQTITITPTTTVDALATELVFNVTNRSGGARVIVNGKSQYASSNTIRINIGHAKTANWQIRANNKTYSDVLKINYKPTVGAGVFKIPALPVAVVYEPVADRNNRNKATYGQTRSIGTKVQMTFSNTNSTQKPATPPQFKTLNAFNSLTKFLSDKFKKSKDPQTKALGTVLGAVSTAMGSVEAHHTEGTTVTSSGALAFEEVVSKNYSTDRNDGGPGVGDIIVYLRDVEIAWLAYEGELSLVLLNHGRASTNTTQQLKQTIHNNPSGLSPETVQNILNINPFAKSGPNANLSSSRFVKVGELELNGVAYEEEFTRTITQTDMQSESKFSTTVTEFNKGWLSYVGMAAVNEDQTKMTSSVWASSNSTSTSQSSSVSLNLHAEIDEIYAVAVYFDKVFGTFATKRVPLNPNPVLAGTATDRFGRTLRNSTVRLTAGGKTFITSTNAQGKYAFRSKSIKGTSGKLTGGGKSKMVSLNRPPVSNSPKPPSTRPRPKPKKNTTTGFPTKRTGSIWHNR